MKVHAFHFVFAIAAALALLTGIAVGYSFSGVAVDIVGQRPIDGFTQQMLYVENAFREGGLQRLLLTDGLLAIHTLRYAVAWPFMTLESVAGSTGPLALMVALIYPLSRYNLPKECGIADRILVVLGRVIPVLLIVLVSGRTSLVAIGAGYVISAMYSTSRPWTLCLIVGVSLISLSSSVELLCLGAVVFGLLVYPWIKRGRPLQLFSAAALISLLIVPSVMAKYHGFTSARDGYLSPQEAILEDASFDHIYGDFAITMPIASSLPERMFYRSTVFVSYAYDQKARLLLYLGSAILAFCYLVYCAVIRRAFDMTVPVAVTMFGPLLEGLGFWAMLWPLVWALTGSGRPLAYLFRKSPTDANERALV